MTQKNRLEFAARLCVLGAICAIAAGCAADLPVAAAGQAPAGQPGPSASQVYAHQRKIVEAMASWYPAVDVEVLWEPCGQENSFYYPSQHEIHLCTEMEAHPGAAAFFAAHEAGHAIATQIAGTDDEHAADEIGALALIRLGLQDDLLQAALYHASQKTQSHWQGDPHPSNGFRGWELSCLADGSEESPVSPECRVLYLATKLRWDRRLSDPQVSDELVELLSRLRLMPVYQ
jgi:hypothetical protein